MRIHESKVSGNHKQADSGGRVVSRSADWLSSDHNGHSLGSGSVVLGYQQTVAAAVREMARENWPVDYNKPA